MANHFSHRLNISIALFLLFIVIILFCSGCIKQPGQSRLYTKNKAPSVLFSGACIDVEGKVLGDIIPDSKVFLYETNSLNYSNIMNHIKTTQPIRSCIVNQSKGFNFNCLYPGKYAFVIHSSSYDGAVGSPLPYEFDCNNFSLRIVFQGGNYHHAVGAFSIENAPAKKECADNFSFCKDYKRSLYRKCPHE